MIKAKRLASDELAVHTVKAVQSGGSGSVTVFDVMNKDVPAGVAAMTLRAVVCDVTSAAVATKWSCLPPPPTMVYSLSHKVTVSLDRVLCDVMGTWIVA